MNRTFLAVMMVAALFAVGGTTLLTNADDDYQHDDYRGYDHKKGNMTDRGEWGEDCLEWGPYMSDDEDFPAQGEDCLKDPHQGTITVTGSATAYTDADRLIVRLGVETMNMTVSQALGENSRLLDSAVSAILEVGISESDIHTSRINISPEYTGTYDNQGNYEQVFVGYHVSNIITVDTAQTDLAADIIDNAVSAGANRVESVSFGQSLETAQQVHDSLLGSAALDAKYRAGLVLDPLGYTIRGVESISVLDSAAYPEPYPRLSAIAYDDALESVSAPIFAQDQENTVQVSVTFTIMPSKILFLAWTP